MTEKLEPKETLDPSDGGEQSTEVLEKFKKLDRDKPSLLMFFLLSAFHFLPLIAISLIIISLCVAGYDYIMSFFDLFLGQ